MLHLSEAYLFFFALHFLALAIPLFGFCDSTFWLLVSTFHILVSTFCLELSTFHFLLSTHSPLFSIRECFSVILSSKSRESGAL